ncbi:hypothetical protein EV702DRAFT_1198742 [Suillus placidus]|uniref:Uncharacterized protein n=1 Tax=Suillus placidus TaxID=48579 RepID=A0A9P6ZSA6_9AGAM|nr:hypothetical protein EV702DRAFT_1198742 [Suillus placidus]
MSSPTVQHNVQLSALAHNHIHQALDAAWADSILRKYCSVIRSFLLFCELKHILPIARCPASEVLLCAFASSRMGNLAGDSVRNHMSALKAWHAYHNAPWHGSSRLHFVLNGVSNLAPSSSSRPPRPPVTRSMLLVLAKHLDLSVSLDACCLAAACVAMWGQLQLGEILSSWEKSFHGPLVACRSNLSTAFNANGSRKLFFPFSKFISQCNSIWSAAGIPIASGHSFRIGGTTELLLSGVPPDVVKALGRWSSDAFLRYWWKLDLLAPRHIENLPPT